MRNQLAMYVKKLFIVVFTLVISLTFSTFAQAKEMENGDYTIEYEVLKAGESSVSIANDYFKKPAKLIVADGKQYLEITIAKSHWTKKVTIDKAKEQLISEDKEEDLRVVQFPIKDVSTEHPGTVDVYINEEVDGEDFLYDNSYEIQFAFDDATIEKTSNEPSAVKADQETNKKVEEKTTSIPAYMTYVAGIIVFLVLVMIIGRQMKGRKSE